MQDLKKGSTLDLTDGASLSEQYALEVARLKNDPSQLREYHILVLEPGQDPSEGELHIVHMTYEERKKVTSKLEEWALAHPDPQRYGEFQSCGTPIAHEELKKRLKRAG